MKTSTFVRAALFAVLAVFALSANAQKTIKIDFDSTADFTESDDVKGTATKSSLTAEQRKKVIAIIQKEYDDAVGAGKVKVSEGKGGDVDVTINGGRAPGVNRGREYGDAGKAGKPGVVHEGEFVNNGFKDDALVNGVAESAAHEAGHKLGIGQHNDDKPAGKMTNLPINDAASNEIRKKDGRQFSAHDIKKLKENGGLASAEFRPGVRVGTDLGVFVGEPVQPQSDDNYLQALVSFTGPAGAKFGYMSMSGEFVFQGDTSDMPYPGFLTFIYTGGADMAVSFDGEILSLSEHEGSFSLSNPNPLNPSVFQTALLSFESGSGSFFQLTLNAMVDPTTGGFLVAVPEPATWAMLAAGLLAVILIRRGAASRPARRS